MRLAAKITSALAIVLALSALLHAFLFRAVIFSGFVRLEAEEARRSMRRCIAALEREIDHLRSVTDDWAQWDDCYQFMQTHDGTFLDANLLDSSFADNRFSLVCFYDEEGVLVWGKAYDLEQEKVIPLGEFFGALPPNHPLMALPPGTNMAAGILLTARGPMMVASGRILTSDNRGPPRGRLVMGRLFDAGEVEALGQQVDAELDVWPIENDAVPVEAAEDLGGLPPDGSPAILSSSSDSLLVYAAVPDLGGTPALLMRINVPRDISARATVTMYYATLAVALAGLLILLTILVLLRHLVVAPAIVLTRDVLEARKVKGATLALSIERADELGTLSREFDKTLQELTEARRHAEQANRAKTDFLNVISHELRTPIGAMIGLAELIGASPVPAQSRDWALRIVAECEALQNLVNELLDIAKAETGKLHIESLPFSPVALLKEVEAMMAGRAGQKGLDFAVRLDPKMPAAVAGDPRRIRQVLINLVENAMKFTERGSVTLEAVVLEDTAENALLRFSVADTGIGIPKARQSALFEDFVQAYDDMARKYGGSGLGTAISRQLVKRMGGDIGLQSEEGKGSMFWVTLRLKKAVVG